MVRVEISGSMKGKVFLVPKKEKQARKWHRKSGDKITGVDEDKFDQNLPIIHKDKFEIFTLNKMN